MGTGNPMRGIFNGVWMGAIMWALIIAGFYYGCA